jgi:hypothetical protein
MGGTREGGMSANVPNCMAAGRTLQNAKGSEEIIVIVGTTVAVVMGRLLLVSWKVEELERQAICNLFGRISYDG